MRAWTTAGRAPWVVTLLFSWGALACGGTSVEGLGAGGTAGAGGASGGAPRGTGGEPASGGTSSGGAPAEALCFDAAQAPPCGDQFFNYVGLGAPTVLALAADIAPASTFVALGGTAALLEVPATESPERYRVVRSDWAAGDGSVDVLDVSWPDAVGAWSVKDIWSEISPDDIHLRPLTVIDTLALACDEAKCLLLGARDVDTALSPLSGTELPPGAQVERFAISPGSGICVYGAEVYCKAEVGWDAPSAVPAAAGLSFAHLLPELQVYEDQPEVEPGVASTDSGALLVEESRGVWTTLEAGSSERGSVVALERDEAFVSVLFEDGTWVADALGAQPATCRQEGGLLWAASVPGWTGRSAVAVDPAGGIFRRLWNRQDELYEWCNPDVEAPPDAFAFSIRACGIGETLLTLSPEAFTAPLGPPSCPID